MAIFSAQQSATPPSLQLEPFKGVNWSVTPTQIGQSQAEDMLNFSLDEKGAINKRTGYERVFPTTLGTGSINGLYEFKRSNGVSVFLIAHGTKLYTQSGLNQPVQIYASLANSKVHFFSMNDKCYIMDGANYLVFDGTTVSAVTPYIPTLSISRLPSGGGTLNEDFNLLGAGFKDSFSADGTATVYNLSLKGLDATAVTAVVNNTSMNEGSGFTVDRTNGTATFTTAPTTGTNNVIITAYKTIAGNSNKIKKCRFSTVFGGANDTRIFLSGNPDIPEYVFRLGLYDPTYAPENGFYKYPDKVTGFSKQYDVLIAHRAKGAHVINFELDSNGNASFPSKPINDQVGTLSTYSIQIIENNPIFLSGNGVYMLVASNVRDERNMTHISENIDTRLLKEASLEQSVSIDYDNKYWLAINGNVYVLDYTQKSMESPFGEWYPYNNIYASCFLEMGGYLYFGSSTDGLVYKFKKETSEVNSYSDDGQPIVAYWKSKPLTFGTDERFKYVDSLYFSMNPASKTSVDIYYISDKKESDLLGGKPIQFNLFDFGNLDFSNFTFYHSTFPKVTKIKIKAKKITHFQLIIKNEKENESLSVLSMGISYRYQSKVR